MAIKSCIGCFHTRISDLQPCASRIGLCFDYSMYVSTTSFCRMRTIPLIRREMLQRGEQVTAKPSPQRIGTLDGSTAEQFGKKIMRQLSRRIFFTTITPQKSHHRSIVGRA